MSTDTKNLNHSAWECQYHVVFTPKYRKKVLYGMIRRDLQDVLHRLAKQKECVMKEGSLMPRSRAYAQLHSTQTQCGKHIGFSERKELGYPLKAGHCYTTMVSGL